MQTGHPNNINAPTCFILIDDDMVANMLAQMAINRHFTQPQIHTFLNPVEAINFITEGEKYNTLPCTVFLDINMPLLTGWEVLEKLNTIIAESNTLFNIYIVSSSIDPEDKERADAHPLVKGYVEKPISQRIMQQVFPK